MSVRSFPWSVPRFDASSGTPTPSAVVPHEDEPQPEDDLPTWEEPETIEDLNQEYVLENKLAGKTAGTSLYIVQSQRRNGTLKDVQPRQAYILFLVPRFYNQFTIISI